MDLQLTGKRILITGSTGGLGRSLALLLAAEGAIVILHGRVAAKTESLAKDVRTQGGTVHTFLADLSKLEEAARLGQEIVSALGGVDVLINNAGVFINRTWMETTGQNWLDTYAVNVASAVELIKAVTPGMQERKWGRIIQIASGGAIYPFPNMPDYDASKAAMSTMAVSLAKTLANTGITVNTVSPGIIATDALKDWYLNVGKQRGWGSDWAVVEKKTVEEILPNTIGRLGREEEVTTLIAYLASPLASFINGSNYRVDGGANATTM